MVRAILEGRKTQTRRIAKQFNMPIFEANAVYKIGDNSFIGWNGGKNIPDIEFTKSVYKESDGVVCPYGNVGDRLWVRETFQWVDMGDDSGYVYRATDPDWEKTEEWKWKPSIFMPRSASRITLEITNIRCEELIAISESDAISEGVEQWPDGTYLYYGKNPGKYNKAYHSYLSLWDQINGEGAWEKNPFVWVIEFKRV